MRSSIGIDENMAYGSISSKRSMSSMNAVSAVISSKTKRDVTNIAKSGNRIEAPVAEEVSGIGVGTGADECLSMMIARYSAPLIN